MQVTLKTTRSAHWAAASGACASALGWGRGLPGVPHASLEGGAARPAQATTNPRPRPAGLPDAFDAEESASRHKAKLLKHDNGRTTRSDKAALTKQVVRAPRPWPPRGTPSGSQDRRERWCTRPRAALRRPSRVQPARWRRSPNSPRFLLPSHQPPAARTVPTLNQKELRPQARQRLQKGR